MIRVIKTNNMPQVACPLCLKEEMVIIEIHADIVTKVPSANPLRACERCAWDLMMQLKGMF